MDTIAMIFSLAGSFLVASKRREGWICFLVSNYLWIYWAAETDAWPLLVTQLGFLISSLNGIRIWYRKLSP